jgi:hypothetical protein
MIIKHENILNNIGFSIKTDISIILTTKKKHAINLKNDKIDSLKTDTEASAHITIIQDHKKVISEVSVGSENDVLDEVNELKKRLPLTSIDNYNTMRVGDSKNHVFKSSTTETNFNIEQFIMSIQDLLIQLEKKISLYTMQIWNFRILQN